MGISSKTMLWVVVILGLISMGSLNVKAQTPAEAPAPESGTSGCMNALYNMSDCLTYVEKGSKLSKPDKNCCPEMAGMLDSNPICLCQLLGKSQDFGLELDMKRALKLPSACKLQTPDVSLCSAVGVPIGAPVAAVGGPMSSAGPSEGPSSSLSPDAMSPEAAGEASAPGKNGASSAHLSVAFLFAGLAVAFTFLKL